MMSKTHITTGIAASLLFLHPDTAASISAAVIGGTFGAVIPDVDSRSTRISRDPLYGRILSGAIIAASIYWGQSQQVNLLKNMLRTHIPPAILTGFLLMALLCVSGRISGHRSFSHSFLFFVLMGGAVYLICPVFLPGYSIGFLSHLLLDCLNKKPVRLFYPVKSGFCMRLCYADGVANTVLFLIGTALSVYGITQAWLPQAIQATNFFGL